MANRNAGNYFNLSLFSHTLKYSRSVNKIYNIATMHHTPSCHQFNVEIPTKVLLKIILKPWSNDRNISTQHIATLLVVT